MKKYAFTLTEILIAMAIIAVMATAMIKNLKTSDFSEKTYSPNAFKVIETFNDASAKIREIESTACPMATFMVNSLGTWEYALQDASSNAANTSDVMNLYKNYLKYQDVDFNFCEYSGYCESSNTSILGMKIIGNVYVGLQVYGDTAVQDCPTSYYIPSQDVEKNRFGTQITKTADKAGKCWANLYVDVNGEKEPNTEGQDVYIWGMNDMGIAY